MFVSGTQSALPFSFLVGSQSPGGAPGIWGFRSLNLMFSFKETTPRETTQAVLGPQPWMTSIQESPKAMDYRVQKIKFVEQQHTAAREHSIPGLLSEVSPFWFRLKFNETCACIQETRVFTSRRLCFSDNFLSS